MSKISRNNLKQLDRTKSKKKKKKICLTNDRIFFLSRIILYVARRLRITKTVNTMRVGTNKMLSQEFEKAG